MADDFYPKTTAGAEKIIVKRGRLITVNHVQDAEPADPDKPWDRPDAPAPLTADKFAVFTSYNSKDVDGEKIRGTDLKVILTPIGLDWLISNRDTISDPVNGDLSIMDVDLLQPGETRVLYTLQVRR